MLKLIILPFVVILLISTIISCNEAEVVCPDTQAYDFKLAVINNSDDTATSVDIYHPDVGKLNASEELSFLVSIPVNLTSDSTSFFIDFIYQQVTLTTIITDTIMFKYLSNSSMNYQECGFILDFELTDSLYTQNKIDTAFWVNNLINDENELNLEIYY